MDLRKSLLTLRNVYNRNHNRNYQKKKTVNNEKVNIDVSVLDDKNNVNFLLTRK